MSIKVSEKGAIDSGRYYILDIVHKNNLILDTVSVDVITYDRLTHYVRIAYRKPYTVKYFGLVVEWLVNNRLADGDIRFLYLGPGYGR